jgi:ketosteroid isomerase-like protein
MNDFQALADRVEIDALRAEFTDAAMMRDRPRLAALFTEDGALRMPNVPAELIGREQIRAVGEKLQAQWDFFIQNSHPGAVVLDGDTAAGRTYTYEIARMRDGRQVQNHAVYHDTYRRTAEGWRFAERVYEVRYADESPLGGDAPQARTEAAGNAFTEPASAARLEKAAEALKANGFNAEILDDTAAARARVAELIPRGAAVFTGASETLRLSGIDEDLNGSGEYDAIRPRLLAMDRATDGDEIRRLAATPDFVLGSVAAVTETGSLVAASGSGSQIPAYSGGAAKAVWIVGAQKIVADLPTALRRVEQHALPLETERALKVYGYPSAVNRLLVLNAEPYPGRSTVLLLREAVGF